MSALAVAARLCRAETRGELPAEVTAAQEDADGGEYSVVLLLWVGHANDGLAELLLLNEPALDAGRERADFAGE